MQKYSSHEKLLICTVGLPATGKTYLSRKVCRYLNWLGYKSSVFNIGNYRRSIFGTAIAINFFDIKNEEAIKQRNICSELAFNDCIKFLLENNGDIAIYDGTNSTKERREFVKSKIENLGSESKQNLKIMWIELITEESAMIETNLQNGMKNNPDFYGIDQNSVLNFLIQSKMLIEEKIKTCKSYYERLSDEEMNEVPYMQIIDNGKKYFIHNLQGFLITKITSFVMNIQFSHRPIYLSRHGESIYNSEDKIGGDSGLSPKGKKYSSCLKSFLNNELSQYKGKVILFTSCMKRTQETVESLKELGLEPTYLRILNEIDVGKFDGLSYEEFKTNYPVDFEERANDKLNYRYPRGESYIDLIQRIEPVIFEIEKSHVPVVLVAHQAVIRCLYAYFTIHEISNIPFLDVPLHTVIKLTPEAYFCSEKRFIIDIENEKTEEKEIEKAQFIPLKDYRYI